MNNTLKYKEKFGNDLTKHIRGMSYDEFDTFISQVEKDTVAAERKKYLVSLRGIQHHWMQEGNTAAFQFLDDIIKKSTLTEPNEDVS